MAYNLVRTSSQYLTAASPSSLAPEPLTLACWFYPNTFTNQGVLLSVQNGANNHRHVLFANAAGINVQLFSGGVGSGSANSTAGYVESQWQHACGVCTSTTSRTIYLDGGSDATNTTSAVLTLGNPTFSIGARLAGIFFDGRIADVGVWNAALTADEVASLAKGMTCNLVRPESLVFYAPLIRNLQDVRRGLAITNNNSATVADHPRVYK